MKRLLGILVLFVASGASGQTYEAGASAYVRESETIDLGDVRGWVGFGVGVPVGETTTGFLAEAGYSTDFLWSVWSTTRTEIKNVIAGTDMKVAKGGPVGGSEFDFDLRVVAGYRFTKNLAVYSYFLEDETPVAFAVGWKF